MKPQIYLRSYSKDEENELSDLLLASTSKLPYTLSAPIEKLAEQVTNGNYGKAMNYALDFFEISVQYLSCVLIAMLQKEEENRAIKHDGLIRAINKIDTKRPLSFGDWINDIYTPLLKAAKDRLSDDKLVQSLNKNMIVNGCNLLLGSKKEPSIVQIRNEYKGHSTTLSEDIYKGVVYTMEPRIFTMLRAVSPLREWSFFSCTEQIGENRYKINRLNGGGEEATINTPESLKPQHYYIRKGEGELLDLFPLFFSNESNYIYIFQSLKDEDIAYVSSNENAVTYTDDRWNESFDAYLQKTLPSFDISKELNWNEIKTKTKSASRIFLEHAYKEKKYNQELFVDRVELSRFFEEFKESDKTLFPLLGEAGQGKTNQLCFWTEQLINNADVSVSKKGDVSVLIFNSSGFSEYTLEEKLKKTFDYGPRKPIQKLLDNIHRNAVSSQATIYFLFDAINECLNYKGGTNDAEGPLFLYQDIYKLLVGNNYTQFKVLFTCRNYTWKNLIQPETLSEDPHLFNANDGEEIAVRGFTKEELAKAYDIYQNLYQMQTSFDSLTKGALIRLKDPLLLKIACTNYLSRELPTSMLSYASLALFYKMLQDISLSYAGNKQCLIVKGLAQHILQEYEKGRATDSISDAELRKAYKNKQSELHQIAQLIYKESDISVAYGELLNKPERPILRFVEDDDGNGQIQFIYERFLEFMLALVFVERESENQEEKTPIAAKTYVDTLEKANTNVVFMGAMRNALIMDYLRTRDLSVILQLIEQFSDKHEIMLLTTDVINVLIQENYETEIFALLHQLLDIQPENGAKLIAQFNAVEKKIESNQADDEVIKEHNKLHQLLAPTIRLRELASVSTVNGIFLSDYFNENLYKENPYSLLWRLINDPINDVRNDACLYLYYLSNKTHTLDYTTLDYNITQRIIQEMYRIVKSTPIPMIALQQETRKKTIILVEAATRLSTLLIIDTLMDTKESNTQLVKTLLDEIKQVFKHFTANFYLLRIMMPFFRMILKRQITFQSIYVNNAIEYQTHWDSSIIPLSHQNPNEWSRRSLPDLLVFIFHYQRYYKEGNSAIDEKNKPNFAEHEAKILSAYKKGDSLSYFALERLLVIMGTCSWDYIRPIVLTFFTKEYRESQWFDYSQMSMLYILFQQVVNSKSINEEIIDLYGREAEDWTRRCRGLFKAHNSHKANPTQRYKRNVMNWYCVVYCRHIGDGNKLSGDEKSVPVFYKLLDEAIEQNDKELLYHLIDNISELVTDYGYIQTALNLLKHILTKLDSIEKIEAIDIITLERTGIYQTDITALIGKVLGTAKNCFPAEVDSFIKKDMIGLKFPGIAKYSAEILNFNPSGETLSDLFTHKFGNFLMWSLLNEEAVDRFAYESMVEVADSPDFIKWFDKVIRILFKHLFEIKL